MQDSKTPLYDKFAQKYRGFQELVATSGLMGWDTQIHMPPQAQRSRSAQSSALAALLHESSQDPKWGKLMEEVLEKEGELLNPEQSFNVKKALKNHRESKLIPSKLIEESAGLSAKGIAHWSRAREEDDYSIFEPIMEQWVRLKKEIGKILHPDLTAYDTCLNRYEEGMLSHVIQPIFDTLKDELPRLFNQIMLQPQPKPLPEGPWPAGFQKHIARFLALRMGFDFERGRMDDAPHPFTLALCPDDVRISSRWDENALFSGIQSLVHETGHGLYEQGLRSDEHSMLPVASTLGMVIHESQSLFWERMVFKSSEFFQWFGPILQSHFPDLLQSWEPEDIHSAVLRVAPTPIRIDADEVTYPLHIILRWEIEQALFDGDLKPADVPHEWNRKTHELLGFEPESLAQGCLQDLHWADGAFGYFPSYTLGAIAAAQMYEQLLKEHPSTGQEIERGQFHKTLQWLGKNVHRRGSFLSAPLLVEDICGQKPCAEPFLKHLRQRYL